MPITCKREKKQDRISEMWKHTVDIFNHVSSVPDIKNWRKPLTPTEKHFNLLWQSGYVVGYFNYNVISNKPTYADI